MIRSMQDAVKLTIAMAEADEREAIYRLRHEVYARELGQHAVNEAGRLTDALDDFNHYITAREGDRLCGFVSITPPVNAATGEPARYSIDKYLKRDELPFMLDDGAYEVRLLTVPREERHGYAAGLLMWAALRWIEARGGTRVVGIGRREVMELYQRVGLEPAGIEVRSGQVRFELMNATIQSLRRSAERFGPRLARMAHRVVWRIDAPFAAAHEPDECYHGGAFFEAIGPGLDKLERRHAVINADVLDAWFDPSPRVVEAVTACLPWMMKTSPPTGCEGMVEAIARHRGVAAANVLPGAGSSDLIFLALRHWLNPSSRVLILEPMYGEYAHVLEKVIGCRVDRFALDREHGYAIDVGALAEQASRGYELIVLVNPNSPTGRFVERGAMRELVRHVPASTRVWIDETYIEYAGPGQSMERIAAGSENIVVCKSMSKVWALSGMRAAYLIGPAGVVRELRRITPPWAVSLPGQAAAIAALKDEAYYESRWRQTHALRDELAAALRERLGWDVLDGCANFLLCHLPAGGPAAKAVVARCRAEGLYLRDASNMGATLGEHAIRIAVKDEATNGRMVEILEGPTVEHRGLRAEIRSV
ncbi:MAG: aminotransferase class I/II-fold pyridoxal phosphate-dependent enzyme [Planctomycetes bacterium]|nr:aminotransferase class I/II-fold pyridoxal phosphate-dependent enzyme [Planctomycetota bacterium]